MAVPNATIESIPYNAQIDDIVNALNDVSMLSGSKAKTGNQSYGGFKITSLGAGTLAGDAARLDQIQTSVVQHSTAVAGTADAIQVTLSPASTTLTTNEVIRWKSGGANTITAPTLSKDGGSTNKTIKKGASAALAVGDTGVSGYECEATYNGTDWILKNPASAFAGGVLTATTSMSGKAFNQAKGAAVASAGTTDIWTPADGNMVHVTGTTGITSFGTAPQAGAMREIIFDGILTITHNATSLILNNAAGNYTTAAGDRAFVFADTTANMIVTIIPASGLSPAGGGTAAAQSDQETATSTTLFVTPGRQQFHPSAAKFWADIDSDGTPVLTTSYNMTSITDTAVGRIGLTIATDFSTSTWAGFYSMNLAATGTQAPTLAILIHYNAMAAGTAELGTRRADTGANTDMGAGTVSAGGYGDQ